MLRVNFRRRLAVELYLDAIGLGTRDVDGTALHPEILLTMQTVFCGSGDVQRQVLHLHILLTTDGVGSITNNIYGTLAF